MKRYWMITIVILLVTGITVLGFSVFKAYNQKSSMTSDLSYKTRVLADSFKESVESIYILNSPNILQRISDRFTEKQKLVGIVVYDKDGNVLVSSGKLSEKAFENSVILNVISSKLVKDRFISVSGSKLYALSEPLIPENEIVGAFTVFQNAEYINLAVLDILTYGFLRSLIQSLLIVFILLMVFRWLVFQPILIVINSIKMVRSGKAEQELDSIKHFPFLKPITSEISKISASLTKARSAASEEARLRLEKTDAPWTEERLKEFVKAYLKNQQIFLVYKGEPFSHHKAKNGGVYYTSQVGGVPTALEPMMEACGGMWIGHGNADADKETVDKDDKIQVPPDNPKYTLKRVWLTEKETSGHDKGYSAQGLYPLCLNTYTRPIFKDEDWVEYKRVNGKFAKVLLAEIKNVQRPIIIINEYHFVLLPQIIKKNRPDARIGIFWHTPWPNVEAFSVCPQGKDILVGILNADVIGFHNQQFGNNFIDTVSKNVEAIVDFDKFTITKNEHTSYIKSFPVGVTFSADKDPQKSILLGKEILKKLQINAKYFGLGVDRLDYVKGIPERFKAIEYFLDNHPEYHKQFVFLQIASPCRTVIDKYLEYKDIVAKEAERINQKFASNGWKPIVLELKSYSREDVDALYKLANICLITSLQDGMNLVSKEYVAERADEQGVLILSQFAGASHELKGALMVNPHSTKDVAEAIYKGLTMPLLEQRKRMKTMRSSVKSYNIYRWAAELLKSIADV